MNIDFILLQQGLLPKCRAQLINVHNVRLILQHEAVSLFAGYLHGNILDCPLHVIIIVCVTGCEWLIRIIAPPVPLSPWIGVYRRNSPSILWEAVEEVSLCPCGIIAPLPATAGSMRCVDRSACAIIAPPHLPLHRTRFVPVTQDVKFSRFKGIKNCPYIYHDIFLPFVRAILKILLKNKP